MGSPGHTLTDPDTDRWAMGGHVFKERQAGSGTRGAVGEQGVSEGVRGPRWVGGRRFLSCETGIGTSTMEQGSPDGTAGLYLSPGVAWSGLWAMDWHTLWSTGSVLSPELRGAAEGLLVHG